MGMGVGAWETGKNFIPSVEDVLQEHVSYAALGNTIR